MIDEKKLKSIINDALETHHSTHTQHHEFLAEFIEHERVKRERWEAIQRQVFGWGIIGIIGTMGAIVARKFGFEL